MKKCLLVILFFYNLSVFSQQKCQPGLKEIYDFEVGDVFIYYIDVYDMSPNPTYHRGPLSMEILSKSVIGDTIMYTYKGFMPNSYAYYREEYPRSETLVDTIILIDSASHFLNQCVNSSFTINVCDNFSVYDECDTASCRISKGDQYTVDNKQISCHGKYAGRSETYAKDLGMVYSDHLPFEVRTITALTHFIRAGDTTKVYSPIETNTVKEQFSVYPNPCVDKLTIIRQNHNIDQVDLYNFQGQFLRTFDLSGNNEDVIIDLSFLSIGVFFLSIQTPDGNIVRRIVKY